MENNPPPYPGTTNPIPGPAYPPGPVVQDALYPPPPKYSADVIQPGPPMVQPIGVIQSQPVMVVNPVVVQPALTDLPAPITCAYCRQSIITETRHENGLLVWLLFGVMLVFGCWPCCLIPFCVDSCKDVQHTCPKCRNTLHIYRRM